MFVSSKVEHATQHRLGYFEKTMSVVCEQMKRQQRKLNFLITQTELYAHFMARKLTGATDAERDAILHHFDEPVSVKPQPVIGGVVCTIPDDDYGLLFLKHTGALCGLRGRK